MEKRINKILSSDASLASKISKLQTLALRCFASSPAQKQVIAVYTALRDGTFNGVPAIEQFFSTKGRSEDGELHR